MNKKELNEIVEKIATDMGVATENVSEALRREFWKKMRAQFLEKGLDNATSGMKISNDVRRKFRYPDLAVK